MDMSVILPYIGAIVIFFIVLKLLALPFKIIIKLVLNGIIGGLIIFGINFIGANLGFMLPLEWWSAILVGILGIPGAIIILLIQLFL